MPHRDLIFLAPADARRMEAAEEHGALAFARAMQREHPEQGVAWEEFGGGHMIFVAKGAPVGRAHGLGFAGKVSAADIEKVEQFYFQHDAAAQVDVCPYADPSLFEAVNQRGFQVAEFNQTLARWIDPGERFRAVLTGMEIRQVRPEEAVTWANLLSGIFFGDQAAQFQDLFTPWAASDNPLCLAALIDGRMIAGAGGIIVPEHRMAAFFGAATLPEYQKRGLQTAFMQERMRIAQQAGCDMAVTLTMPGTTSQRNVERAGFRVAYTKVVVTKAPPGLGAQPK
ncbi:MAG: GNAT family N-acetyltransferase [Acidobacteriia bacterium]|nr:GNAT family N-acetyltransferase [Terriglobia bacterium]